MPDSFTDRFGIGGFHGKYSWEEIDIRGGGEGGGEDTRWGVMILVAALFACEVRFAWRPRVDVGTLPRQTLRFFFSGRPTVVS